MEYTAREWILEMEKPAVASTGWQILFHRTKSKSSHFQSKRHSRRPLSIFLKSNLRLFPPFALSSPLPNTQPSCSASAPPLRGQLLAVTSGRCWWCVRVGGGGGGLTMLLINTWSNLQLMPYDHHGGIPRAAFWFDYSSKHDLAATQKASTSTNTHSRSSS